MPNLLGNCKRRTIHSRKSSRCFNRAPCSRDASALLLIEALRSQCRVCHRRRLDQFAGGSLRGGLVVDRQSALCLRLQIQERGHHANGRNEFPVQSCGPERHQSELRLARGFALASSAARIEYQPKDRIPKGEGRFSTIARESRILRKSSEARAGIGPFLARFRDKFTHFRGLHKLTRSLLTHYTVTAPLLTFLLTLEAWDQESVFRAKTRRRSQVP